MKVLENYSLKQSNTFRINAIARFFVEVNTSDELLYVITNKKFSEMSKLMLGSGSNVLFSGDYNGIIIKNSISGINIVNENERFISICVGAGEIWHDLVLYCINKNIGGIENLSLIPGTVGAAPMQNIGAYGQEVKDVFESLSGYYLNGEKDIFNKEECRFGYRDSIFKKELKNRFVITNVTLRLSKNPELNLEYGTIIEELKKLEITNPSVKDVSDVICKIRKSKLPDPQKIGNAGSFFKNPVIDSEKFNDLKQEFPDLIGYNIKNNKVKLAAGWLIESCGWKGKRVGNTGSHIKQALVLVNYGNATGEEILNLAAKIKSSVKEKFDVELEEEINII
ncbi:MAG TPA: UDP-N-acetylmuramate dehydrogenase [Ignavibacteriaceae bacterium]|nr:UDP-N-acetylmuramate dehydrogenase [Ignavibacteriaceae bacterium]